MRHIQRGNPASRTQKDGRRNFFQKALGLAVFSGILAPFSRLNAGPSSVAHTDLPDVLGMTASPLLGQLALFGFSFAPSGWAKCDGQLLQISQNTALFSLLGTTYGGNGQTTFALPDLRGRAPIHYGTGPGLGSRVMGQKAGTQNISGVPAHSHTGTVAYPASTNQGDDMSPTGRFPGSAPTDFYADASNTTMGTGNVTVASSGGTVSNEMPYLVMNYCIALTGVFPSPN